MTARDVPAADVRIELLVRVSYARAPGKLSHVLRVVRNTGGSVRAHLMYRFYEQESVFVLCDHASEAALELVQEGLEAETQTVVTICTQDRPGLLRALILTLEAESIVVGFSYASTSADSVLFVFRTNDNPKAEDVLRNYLIPAVYEAGRASTMG